MPGYLRCTRYKLLYYRTNAQSRVLKGLPPRAADIDIKEPPTFLAIHEFETESVDMQVLLKSTQTEWAKKVLPGSKTTEGGVWSLQGSFGNKKFFQ